MTRTHEIVDLSTDPPTITVTSFTPDEEAAADAAAAITGSQVDAERDRRRYLDISVTLSVGTIPINMDATAQNNIQGLVSVGLYLSGAAPAQTTVFRDLSNTNHDLPPSDLIGMGLQVAAHIQALYVKSWAIKATNPIPADFANDSYWA